MNKRYFFIDGLIKELKSMDSKRLSPWELSGSGVFETMQVSKGKILFLDQHLKRLKNSLKDLNVTFPPTKKQLHEFLYLTLKKNRLRNARLRLTVWKDKSKVHISILVFKHKPISASKYRLGMKGAVSKININERKKSANLKTIKYGDFIKAYRLALRQKADEALMLNLKGEVVEASRANLFYVKNGVLYTPTLAAGCLKGITRDQILQLAKSQKIPVKRIRPKIEDILGAQEAFLTNSMTGIVPLTYVGQQVIGKGIRGPLTAKLSKLYQNRIKKDLSSGKNCFLTSSCS